MKTTASLLLELAALHEQVAEALRSDAAALDDGSTPAKAPMEQALEVHPKMGPRQREIMQLVIDAGAAGTDTGVISRAIGYTQPNVHLTLKGLIGWGLVRKDAEARPQRYYADPRLVGE